VEESDLDQADRRVGMLLKNKSIDPDEITDFGALDLLRDLAVALATGLAATRGADSADSGMYEKAKAYESQAKTLAAGIDRESLGLAEPGSGSAGYGSISVGRG